MRCKNINCGRIKKRLIEELRVIIENSKFDYEDLLNEIKLIATLFKNQNDVEVNLNEIIDKIKQNDSMPIEDFFNIE